MIECINQLQVSIIERLDHLQMLLLDSDQMAIILKDEQKKRAVVKNFRIIKGAQKTRSVLESKCLFTLSKLNRKLTKNQINICQNMFVNCMNQYLNTEYQAKNNGEINQIIDALIFYYQKIKCNSKVKQLTVTKNCGLFYQVNCLYENISFFISNTQQTLNQVYEKQKQHLLNFLKFQNRNISPEKKMSQDDDIEKAQRFDKTGLSFVKKKKNLQNYCFQIAKLLQLEPVYIDYFYFSSMDYQRRKKILQGNIIKRNIHIIRQIQQFDKDFQNYKTKKKNI